MAATHVCWGVRSWSVVCVPPVNVDDDEEVVILWGALSGCFFLLGTVFDVRLWITTVRRLIEEFLIVRSRYLNLFCTFLV